MSISGGAERRPAGVHAISPSRRDTSTVAASLEQRHLSVFQSYVVSEFAAEYLCPTQLPHALTDLRQALVAGS